MKNKLFRQGDVLLMKVNKIPFGAKEKDNVLAYGEVTGHKHVLNGGQVSIFEDQQYVSVPKAGSVVHEEHDEIVVPKGLYKVVLQREFDVLGRVRQVMD